MLKKLFKHEFKSISGMGIMLLIAMVAMTLMAWVSFKSPMWTTMFSDDSAGFSFHITDVVGIFVLMFYFIVISIISVGYTIYLGIHFYRSMYTDQGYLTHTLPVTPVQLLLSKVFASGIWSLIINLTMFASMMIVILSFIGAILTGVGADWALVRVTMKDVWSEIVYELQYQADFNVYIFGALMLFILVVTPFLAIIVMYGGISLGQLSKKGRGVLGFVWYVLILFAQMIVSYIISLVLTFNALAQNFENSELATLSMYNESYTTTIILQIISAIVLWCVSVWILKKKINLH